MEIKKTHLKDCYILKPKLFEDSRGYFYESFNKELFNKLTGLDVNFVQDNQSYSTHGVIRGLHAQRGEHAQAKLVRVLKGEVLDVAVDARKDSPTFGEHVAIRLSEENRLQLFVPRGFLHGFAVLSETAEFFYKCDNYYDKESEFGVIYNDQDLNIDWQVQIDKQVVSEKDLILSNFSTL